MSEADANEADLVEQRQDVVPGDDGDEREGAVLPVEVADREAEPADVLEQAAPVAIDDEDRADPGADEDDRA